MENISCMGENILTLVGRCILKCSQNTHCNAHCMIKAFFFFFYGSCHVDVSTKKTVFNERFH